MNQAKAKKLLRDQTSLALAVYDAVPVTEAWTRAMVAGELDRGGHTASMKAIEGCLYSLVDDGLIKEPKKGYFIRQKISAPNSPRPTLHVAQSSPSQQPFQLLEEEDPMADPIDIFEGLKKRLNDLSAHVDNEIQAVQKAMDEAALKCMEQQESNSEELEKLRALANAMKALQ